MIYTTDIDDSYDNHEYIQTIQELFGNDFHGDCDDFAMFYYIIAERKGLDVKLVLSYNHVWIQISGVEYDSTSYHICDNCISERYNNETTAYKL